MSNSPVEQLSHTERVFVRHGTDRTFDSTSTIEWNKWDMNFGQSTLEPQSSVHRPTPSPHSPIEVADEKADPIGRASPGQRRRFRLHWVTTYRVLITSVFLTNIGFLVCQLGSNANLETSLTATSTNIMVAVMSRQENVINISFKLVSKAPSTLPLAFRKLIGNFHHYGGIHIGCALSALLWYCVFVGLNTVRVLDLLKLGNRTTMLYIDIAVAYATLFAVVLVCATAIPRFRVRFHNTFEETHRFGGWVTLLVLWVHAGVVTLAPDAQAPLYTHPSIWMLAITTIFVILPWLRIRRVPITASLISAREIQLTFPYASMPYTSTIRTSTAPLTQWHAFATIPVTSTSAKIIISQAGDWTKSTIASPPPTIWIRNPPTLNFLTLAPLFTSLLLVATGAGIGPMLSLLSSPTMAKMLARSRQVRVMWCVHEPHAPHWAFVLDAIRKVDGVARVFDSKTGRPDVAFEARYLAKTAKVEAVMVVSNPKLTRDVVDECQLNGLAAYGAVFDS